MTLTKAKRMAAHGNYRMALVEAMPNPLFIKIYNTITPHHIHRTANGPYSVWVDDERYYIPRPKDALRLTHIGENPRRRVWNKYVTPRIKPEPGDFVVDVGAFIGEFTMACQQEGCDVLAIEPDPLNHSCLSYNVNGPTANIGIFDDYDEMEFNLGVDGAETSVLEPDDGQVRGTITVETRRLDEFLGETPDFLKVEAEGMEPEVLQSLGDMEPPKIAVNVSPERNGESPESLVLDWFEDRKYTIVRHGEALTAWKEGDV